MSVGGPVYAAGDEEARVREAGLGRAPLLTPVPLVEPRTRR